MSSPSSSEKPPAYKAKMDLTRSSDGLVILRITRKTPVPPDVYAMWQEACRVIIRTLIERNELRVGAASQGKPFILSKLKGYKKEREDTNKEIPPSESAIPPAEQSSSDLEKDRDFYDTWSKLMTTKFEQGILWFFVRKIDEIRPIPEAAVKRPRTLTLHAHAARDACMYEDLDAYLRRTQGSSTGAKPSVSEMEGIAGNYACLVGQAKSEKPPPPSVVRESADSAPSPPEAASLLTAATSDDKSLEFDRFVLWNLQWLEPFKSVDDVIGFVRGHFSRRGFTVFGLEDSLGPGERTALEKAQELLGPEEWEKWGDCMVPTIEESSSEGFTAETSDEEEEEEE